MDGTFKTVPNLFYQLYTIHAPVGQLHSVPLVYVLMTSKKEELYKLMLQELSDFAAENHIELCPEVIITDLELAAINASKHEFPTTTNKACNFHLGQCIWRKIQSLGYASRYGTDEDFNLKLRHLLALAFLPSNEIPDAFDLLKSLLIPDASELLDWFEQNYVYGRIKRTARNKTQTRTILLFPPIFWSVHDSIAKGIPRTQNLLEAWHRRWENLIGASHVGVYRIIQHMQEEQHQVDAQVERALRGEMQVKGKKLAQERREVRILKVYHEKKIGVCWNICAESHTTCIIYS